MARELNAEVQRLIARHRRSGVVLDTNLLVLWFVGSRNPALITRHKRTAAFSIGDFELLTDLLARHQRQVTTPNVLTETINLLMQTDGTAQDALLRDFRAQVVNFQESYTRTSELVANSRFPALRLTDTSLLRAAERGRLVISVDFKLCGIIAAGGGSAINFNHLRRI